jgi:hypothetical protein
MARYNTVASVTTQSGAASLSTPAQGLFTTLAGTAPFTVTLSAPAVATGTQQGFYNNSGGVVTLQSPSGNIKGPSANTAATFVMQNQSVVFLTSDGTNYILTGAVSGGFVNVDVTTTYTASASQALWVNTTSAAINITLPASPARGDTIRIYDIANTFDTNQCQLLRNGQVIMGGASDLQITTEGAALEVVYSNATYGWRIFTI